MLGIGLLVTVAALLAAPPAPALLAAMAVSGVLAVTSDRFNPDGLRWRVAGGLALYALAALAYIAYGRYLGALDAAAWAQALGGQGGGGAGAGAGPRLRGHPGDLGAVAHPPARLLLAAGPGDAGASGARGATWANCPARPSSAA